MIVLNIIDGARGHLKDQIKNRTAGAFPEDSAATTFSDTEMVSWLNMAQIELQNILCQSFENYFVTQTGITIVANQDDYDMPCGCLQILRVEDVVNTAAPVECIPISFNEKDRHLYGLAMNLSANQNVKYYSIHGDKLNFRPIPNTGAVSGIRVWYTKILTDITADVCGANYVPEIPAQYHELLMWGVVEQGMIRQEANAEALAAILGRRNRLVDQMIKGSEDRQLQRSRKVKRSKGYI